ncbi:sce7726 family protein [Crassaminicella thermophila]|uniref:Sce7726 family protein n=1 Tax=Crassaminicella thermophila TaxID=2599308 RepID=A0A5C0SC66_CRATE|nr:sce7726 family protein [Crassaminicella thermophila]QEK11710.1 sce7726 family protein [Crassaminicella thermophila]
MKIYDPDIRELLLKKFLKTKAFISDPTTKLIHEMDVCFGTSRIDIAVINGKIHGYEIKSEQDTLDRLPAQIESYNKIFDTMTIVTGENHISKVIEIVPDWWGIYYVVKKSNQPILKRKRQFKINKKVDTFYLAQLLWKNELLELLRLNGINKGVKSKTRFALCEIVNENIEKQKIKDFVRKKLKSRESWRAVQLQQLCDDLPQ